MSPRRLLACSAVVLGALTACGDGSSSTTTASTTTSTVAIAPTSAPTSNGARPTMVTSAPVPISTGGPTTSGTTTTAGAITTATATTLTPTTTIIGGGPTTTVAGDPLVLRPSGLGTVMFGTAPDTVIAAVTDDLGAPTRDSGWTDPLSLGSCPGTKVRTVQWDDLSLYFGDESTVVTGRDHFFAYSYGPAAATASPAGLTIDGGGTLGTTVAALRTAHPSLQLYPADPTAPASFAVNDGLTGQLSGVADTDVVTRIQGGIGCGE